MRLLTNRKLRNIIDREVSREREAMINHRRMEDLEREMWRKTDDLERRLCIVEDTLRNPKTFHVDSNGLVTTEDMAKRIR